MALANEECHCVLWHNHFQTVTWMQLWGKQRRFNIIGQRRIWFRNSNDHQCHWHHGHWMSCLQDFAHGKITAPIPASRNCKLWRTNDCQGTMNISSVSNSGVPLLLVNSYLKLASRQAEPMNQNAKLACADQQRKALCAGDDPNGFALILAEGAPRHSTTCFFGPRIRCTNSVLDNGIKNMNLIEIAPSNRRGMRFLMLT